MRSKCRCLPLEKSAGKRSEKYVKRLADLGKVACGFPGVEQAYAIQAGRELRVIASAHKTTDADAVRICRDIARAIEQQLDYP